LNKTQFQNRATFLSFLHSRPQGRGLVTVSNHTSAFDDPAMVLSLVRAKDLLDAGLLRWTLCAQDRCFNVNDTVTNFFQAAKVLPVQRGKGLHQTGMQSAVSKLEAGEWVHLFPEGTRSRDGNLGDMKMGVGMLVADPAITPIVLPFYHVHKLPNIGTRSYIMVGEPLYFEQEVEDMRTRGIEPKVMYRTVADKVGETLWRLRQATLKWHAEEEAKRKERSLWAMWDMLGIFDRERRVRVRLEHRDRAGVLAEAVSEEERGWILRHWMKSDELKEKMLRVKEKAREKKEKLRHRLWCYVMKKLYYS
jgi:monolysocardiolipin acyltransferase